VPRRDVAACPATRALMHRVKHPKTMAAKRGFWKKGFVLETPQAVDDIPCLPVISITFFVRSRKPRNITIIREG
jgi:hypothetical protein